MRTGMQRKTAFAATALCASLLTFACEKQAQGPKPCCEQPEIPAGAVQFRIVADETSGPPDGQRVILRAGLTQSAKRDQIYMPLKILYRHAMQRSTFEPIHFEGWLYANESDAKAGGEARVIAKVIREQTEKAPKCENNVKYDFAEQVERAFIWSTQGEQALAEDLSDTCHIGEKKKVARYDEKFAHKTLYKLDPARSAVEITYHFLDMGKDEYVAELKANSAMGAWAEFMTSMFSHAEPLKEVTFLGMYKDAQAMKVVVTRQQFDSILARLQEQIASHAAFTFQVIGMGKKSSEAAEKEQEKFKAKAYKNALDKLPKEQVAISPVMKWVK